MDPVLKLILGIFLVYGLIGGVPLYWAKIATSQKERFFAGLMLMYYAAFMLTGLAIVTGAAESLKLNDVNLKEQLAGFMQYIFLLGFIFTFLFGGVGTNIVTSALTASDNIDIADSLKRIENKLYELESQNKEVIKWHKAFVISNVVVLIVGIYILWWLFTVKS